MFLKAGEIYGGRTHAGVVQDKQPPGRMTAATVQPATANDPAVGSKGGVASAVITVHEHRADTQQAVDRPTHHGSETRRTEQVTGRVSPVLKAQLLKLAKVQGAKTESRAVKMAVEVFVANEFGQQFLEKIRQTIQEIIRQEFQAYTNRFGKLTFSAYLAAEQGMDLLTSPCTHVGRNSSPPPLITNRTKTMPGLPQGSRGAVR